jgi:hypothetical protein
MPNTVERRHVGSETTQKQKKHEQANPETTCGTDEDTASVLVHAKKEPLTSFSAGALWRVHPVLYRVQLVVPKSA